MERFLVFLHISTSSHIFSPNFDGRGRPWADLDILNSKSLKYSKIILNPLPNSPEPSKFPAFTRLCVSSWYIFCTLIFDFPKK